jgi:hypothetical protein
MAADLPPGPARLARKALARLAKKNRDFLQACELWTDTVGERDASGPISREALDAYAELAIHFERRAGDPHHAATLVREALAELARARRLGTISPASCLRYQSEFRKRLRRLDRKIAAGLLPACAAKAESVAEVRESN